MQFVLKKSASNAIEIRKIMQSSTKKNNLKIVDFKMQIT
jgi:hypothetical protein